jgi:hypothetical protein
MAIQTVELNPSELVDSWFWEIAKCGRVCIEKLQSFFPLTLYFKLTAVFS